MGGRKRERRSRRITLEQARTKQGKLSFDKRPDRKERSLMSIYTSIILTALLLGSILFYLFHERAKSTPNTSGNPPINEQELKEIDMEFKTPPVKWTGKLPKEVLKEFREAKTIEDYLKHLDHLDKVEKDAREFFSAGPGSRQKITSFVKLPDFHTRDETTYIRFQAILESGYIRMIVLRRDPTGPKIDFDAYSRRGSHSWNDLLSGETTEASEIRLGIRPDNFYLGEFRDDTIWQSFRGITPDHEEQISLYLRRDQISASLQKIIERNLTTRATVSLSSIGESHQKKQFEVSKAHQFNWLTLPHRRSKQTPLSE
ncbi:hypothetical protein OAF66_00935 [bacterium]|nr:hypothetical protein [bacterium]